jgi:hypothetical protein
MKQPAFMKNDTIVYRNFRESITNSWQKIDEIRLSKMEKWEQDHFSKQMNDTLMLFYPFSGPDFLHAWYLFPEATDYVFLALERLHEIPRFEMMEPATLALYLDDVQKWLRDIYKRSYFITLHMDQDMYQAKIKGILPIFYVFLARTGHEILQTKRITLNEQGVVVMRKSVADSIFKAEKMLDGVKIIFRERGKEQIKTLVYFDCDISDEGFDANPELLTYLNHLPSCNTLVKSASYLLHYRTFTDIRNLILDRSKSVFQDDTGIPLRYYTKDKWNIQLYGWYEHPVKDFDSTVYQPDLARAYYVDTTRLDVPFSLGYHWATRVQNQMLALKKPDSTLKKVAETD